MSELARVMLGLQQPGVRLVFGTATGSNRVSIMGGTPVKCDALQPGVVAGDWCAVLVYGDEASGGRLILGPITLA